MRLSLPRRLAAPLAARRRLAGVLLFLLAALVLLTGLLPRWPDYAWLALRAPLAAYRLLGFDRPRTYLVLGQNNEEPRPTGGFIGSLAVLKLEDGGIDSFVARDSTDFIDQNAPVVDPPEPFARYMGFGTWYLRDANWSADFRAAAEQIDWFWRRDQPDALDGVVAFDYEFLVLLLGAVGPVEVPEFDETIAAQNFRERSLYWVYPANSTGSQQFRPGAKTDFVSQASKAILAKVRRPPILRIPALVGAILEGIETKHVLIFARDPLVADLAAELGADGRVRATAGDYLLPVDATMSYTKNAPYVDEALDYQVRVRPEDGLLHAVLATTYSNRYDPAVARRAYPRWYLGAFWNWRTGQMDDREGFWATYLRAYVPRGAILLDARGFEDLPRYGQDAGRAVLGGFLPIDAGQRKRVEFEYAVPGGLVRTSAGLEYRLTVQQQPGRGPRPLRVGVEVPPGWALVPVGGAVSPDGRRAQWTASLDRDLAVRAAVVRR